MRRVFVVRDLSRGYDFSISRQFQYGCASFQRNRIILVHTSIILNAPNESYLVGLLNHRELL